MNRKQMIDGIIADVNEMDHEQKAEVLRRALLRLSDANLASLLQEVQGDFETDVRS